MNDYQLSDEDIRILDIIANLEPLPQYLISGFWLSRDRAFLTEHVDEILNKLSQLKLISVKSAEHQITISLDDSAKEKVLNILSIYWKRKNIQMETLIAKAENNYTGVQNSSN